MRPAQPKRQHRPPVAPRRALRAEVFARDKGVCSECGRDTVALRAAIAALRPFHAYIRPEVVKSSRWEAHHVVSLAEGGTDDLPNLVSLCGLCHAPETAALRRRTGRRQSVKARAGLCEGSGRAVRRSSYSPVAGEVRQHGHCRVCSRIVEADRQGRARPHPCPKEPTT